MASPAQTAAALREEHERLPRLIAGARRRLGELVASGGRHDEESAALARLTARRDELDAGIEAAEAMAAEERRRAEEAAIAEAAAEAAILDAQRRDAARKFDDALEQLAEAHDDLVDAWQRHCDAARRGRAPAVPLGRLPTLLRGAAWANCGRRVVEQLGIGGIPAAHHRPLADAIPDPNPEGGRA